MLNAIQLLSRRTMLLGVEPSVIQSQEVDLHSSRKDDKFLKIGCKVMRGADVGCEVKFFGFLANLVELVV